MIVTLLAGSNHPHSTTGRLCRYMATYMASRGHETRVFDVVERPLPMFTEAVRTWDDEHVRTLRSWMAESDAIVLATPEYHGSVSGVLKNAIDFLWKELGGKVVMPVSVCGGALGVTSLTHLNTMVRSCHGVSSPEWISLGAADRELHDTGEPTSEKAAARVRRGCDALLSLAERVRAPSGATP